MRAHAPLLALAGALVGCGLGCQADDSPRFTSDEDHFSIIELDDWTRKRDRSSLVFVGPDTLAAQRNTITVRAVPRNGDWVNERTPALVVSATETVLRSLPGANVSAPETVKREGLRGASFLMTFTPRGKDMRYAREHVALVGRQYVYHLIHTAPDGELGRTAEVFKAVVRSLREEA